MKTCTICKTEKSIDDFHKNKNSTDGYSYQCKECIKLRKLELKKNPIMQLEKQIRSSIMMENKLLKRENKKLCCSCKGVFLIEDLKHNDYCIDCRLKNDKKYYKNNKEVFKEKRKEYREKNKEIITKRKREWYDKNIDKKKEYDKQYRLKKKLEMQNNT